MTIRVNKTILYLIDTTGPGGAETVFIQLADKIRAKGWKPIVVIRGKGWVYDELCRRNISPIILDAKGSFNFRFLWDLIKIIKKESVGLIHSHLLGSNVYASLVGLLTGCPVVATYHGMVDIAPNERFKNIKQWAMRWGIARYVSVSHSLADSIREKKLLSMEKTSVIYNGVDASVYGLDSGTGIRDKLGLGSEAVLVGSLGNVRPAKAYDILIEAASQVVKNCPEVHFVIAGDNKNSLMSQLDRRLNELNLGDVVHFIGFQSNSAAMLSQMDVFLLSSTSEGFSISTIEAMATGLPVLVTRCGGPEEIITHAQNGWMVDKDNAQALAEGLIFLLGHERERQKISENALSHVRNFFSLDKMVSEYESLYKGVVAKG